VYSVMIVSLVLRATLRPSSCVAALCSLPVTPATLLLPSPLSHHSNRPHASTHLPPSHATEAALIRGECGDGAHARNQLELARKSRMSRLAHQIQGAANLRPYGTKRQR